MILHKNFVFFTFDLSFQSYDMDSNKKEDGRTFDTTRFIQFSFPVFRESECIVPNF